MNEIVEKGKQSNRYSDFRNLLSCILHLFILNMIHIGKHKESLIHFQILRIINGFVYEKLQFFVGVVRLFFAKASCTLNHPKKSPTGKKLYISVLTSLG